MQLEQKNDYLNKKELKVQKTVLHGVTEFTISPKFVYVFVT